MTLPPGRGCRYILRLLSVFVRIRLAWCGLFNPRAGAKLIKLRVQKLQINNLDGNRRYEAVPAWPGEPHPFDFLRRIGQGVGVPKSVKADRYPTQKHRVAEFPIEYVSKGLGAWRFGPPLGIAPARDTAKSFKRSEVG